MASDPVADKSSFLCMYMSNHPDTLVAYVKYWGKVKGPVTSASMVSINSKSMTLDYSTTKEIGKKDQKVVVEFDPPLAGYEEVKPRLLSMTADAQESLGMTKVPQITHFELTSEIFKTLIPLSFLAYTVLAPSYHGQVWALGQWLNLAVGGPGVVKFIAVSAAVVHLLEAWYAARLAVKHRMGAVVGTLYTVSVLVCGFTVLLPLRRKIQKARIDSIMKGN